MSVLKRILNLSLLDSIERQSLSLLPSDLVFFRLSSIGAFLTFGLILSLLLIVLVLALLVFADEFLEFF